MKKVVPLVSLRAQVKSIAGSIYFLKKLFKAILKKYSYEYLRAQSPDSSRLDPTVFYYHKRNLKIIVVNSLPSIDDTLQPEHESLIKLSFFPKISRN